MAFISNHGAPVYVVASLSADLAVNQNKVNQVTPTQIFNVILEQSTRTCYDVSNQYFTAPVNGLYYFKTHLSMLNNTASSDDSLRWGYKIVRNSGLTTHRLSGDNFNALSTTVREITFTLSMTMSLNTNDKVYLYSEGWTTQTVFLANRCHYMAHLLSQMTILSNPSAPYAEYANKITLYNPTDVTQSTGLYSATTTISTTSTVAGGVATYTHALGNATNYMLAVAIGGGGGGSGGNYQNGGQNGGSGGGGGAGAIRYGYYSVTPGTSITVNTGYGGLGGSSGYTVFDASATALIVGGSGQVGANSSVVYNGTKLLDASGGSGSLSVTSGASTTITTNSSIYSIRNDIGNGPGGLAGVGGSDLGTQGGILNGSANGAAGTAGSHNSTSGGASLAGGAGGSNSFTNFIVSNGRQFFPPVGTSTFPDVFYQLVNNSITSYNFTTYGAGGAGGRGEGGSLNNYTSGSIGKNGAVFIFEYSY